MMAFADGMRRMIKGFMLKHGPGMITCEEFETFILDYLDGALPPAQRRVFEWHLKICRECRDYLEAYRASIALGKAAMQEVDAPEIDEVPEDLVRAVLDAREK